MSEKPVDAKILLTVDQETKTLHAASSMPGIQIGFAIENLIGVIQASADVVEVELAEAALDTYSSFQVGVVAMWWHDILKLERVADDDAEFPQMSAEVPPGAKRTEIPEAVKVAFAHVRQFHPDITTLVVYRGGTMIFTDDDGFLVKVSLRASFDILSNVMSAVTNVPAMFYMALENDEV